MALYDKVDWHRASAIEAGQPPEHAATHIGLFLGWLARHDLLDPTDLDAGELESVRRGELPGSVLLESFGDKLLSIAMTFEGDAFAAARYGAYTEAYGFAFKDRPDYSIADDAQSTGIVEPILGRLYSDWVADGRPGPPAKESPGSRRETLSVDPSGPGGVLFVPPGLSSDLLELFAKEARDLGHDLRVMPPPRPPDDDLAALIPADLTDPPLQLSGRRAISEPRTSRLRRALDRLGVDAQSVGSAAGIGGGAGPSTLAITLYRVPGIDSVRLGEEFESVIAKPARSTWTRKSIAGRDVRWIETPEFTQSFWARDEMVVHVAGSPSEIERVIPKLP